MLITLRRHLIGLILLTNSSRSLDKRKKGELLKTDEYTMSNGQLV